MKQDKCRVQVVAYVNDMMILISGIFFIVISRILEDALVEVTKTNSIVRVIRIKTNLQCCEVARVRMLNSKVLLEFHTVFEGPAM